MVKSVLVTLAAAAMIVCGAYPAAAQGRSGDMNQGRSYYTDSRTMGMESGAPAPGDLSQRWVRVGFDYNNDGVIDHWEYINAQDLERAQSRSMQRERTPEANGPAREEQPYGSGPSAGAAGWQGAQMQSVTGAVSDLRQVGIAGMRQPQVIGKIRTPEGRTARVDFGPAGSLEGLDLRQGDRVTVYGSTGTLDERAMLMAHRIETGNRVVTVGWPYDRDLSRYSGEILAVRTARFDRPRAPEQTFARVLLDQGGVTAVNLGPIQDLRNMSPADLQGKHISFLAHPAKIGDRVALVAEEVRVDGRTIHIDWSESVPRT